MTGIVGFSIRNWRMTIGIMLFAVIGGILAMGQLPLDAEPDIPVPVINVRVVLPGVSPEDSQRLLVRPLETELKSVEGLKELNTVGATSVGYATLEFNASFDQNQAVQDVLEKVNRARAEFPQEAREPLVQEVNTSSFPIFVVNLHGAVPERELQARAKYVQRQLESIPEVLQARISGERTNILEAEIDPALVQSSGITFDEIAAAVARNNALITAGALETEAGKFNVKVPGLIEDADDLRNLIIRRNADGGIIRMTDIANVKDSYKDVDTFARFNGQTSLSLEITKRTGENIIDTIDKVEARVNEISARPDWPSTISVTYSQDKSVYIMEMVTSLFSSIVNAVILVFIVCIAALGLRSALFVGWAIPASFLMALFMFYVQGESLNMMIMFGLILSVGVLVDSAIVIIEYADRKLAEGLPRKQAFQIAGERMFWPIVSSTATTLAAFIPLLFWDSVTGKFMSFFPRTMIYVLTASLLMAVVFLPTMGALIGPRKITKSTSNLKALSGKQGDPLSLTGPTGVYVRAINYLIYRPIRVIISLILLAVMIVLSFMSAMNGDPPKPVEFFTQEPSDRIYILARARGNTTANDALNIAKNIENLLADHPDIAAIYTVAGAGAGGSSSTGLSGPSNVPGDTVARIYTELRPFEERKTEILDIMDEFRDRVKDIPGVYTEITAEDSGPPIGKDIEIQISADEIGLLRDTVLQVREKFESMEAIFEIEDSLPLPGIEWQLEVDRIEAGRLGLNVSQIGSVIQFITEGSLVAQYRPLDVDEEVDIRVRYPASARDIKALDNLRILTPDGAIPLSTIVKRVAKPRQDQIVRRDLQYIYEVKANTRAEFATNVQVNEIKEWLRTEANIPEGVSYKFLGQDEENAETTQFGIAAAMAILFMMGVILLLQFNSIYHVFLTLMAVIMSVFGVLLGITFYSYVSIVLMMTGVIALAGIVVNNNIVLIDTYQRLLETGYSPEDAAVRTAAQRLRPVLLTTLTTVVGLMPLILGWQADIFTGEFSTRGTATSSIWAPISYIIACGLTFATILTLIVTPVLLAAPTIWKRRIIRLLVRFKMIEEKPALQPAAEAPHPAE